MEGAGRGGCIAAAALIGFCIAAALGAVARAGTAGEEMPFLAAGGGGPAAVACICAVLTTLFSSFYPLARAAEQYSAEKGGKERHKKRKEEHTAGAERGAEESRALPVRERAAAVQAGLCAGAFLLSLCGLSGIVRAVYPLIGMAGAAFFLLLAARRLPSLLSSSPAQQQLFRQRHQGVHARGQQAEDGGRRHHQV